MPGLRHLPQPHCVELSYWSFFGLSAGLPGTLCLASGPKPVGGESCPPQHRAESCRGSALQMVLQEYSSSSLLPGHNQSSSGPHLHSGLISHLFLLPLPSPGSFLFIFNHLRSSRLHSRFSLEPPLSTPTGHTPSLFSAVS